MVVHASGSFPESHVNGRETFLAAVNWVDDWPVAVEEQVAGGFTGRVIGVETLGADAPLTRFEHQPQPVPDTGPRFGLTAIPPPERKVT
ncbi:hypothetical protein ACFYXF_04150 [Streptomyces sp. NPDC002680]|uniref:hypothetical protein n=1 Tax=Streptomyces sp. NPDC002680 TaxID=3364659 RepID=UPI0036C7FAEB